MSLAMAGHIERDLTVEQLRERLGSLLRRYVPQSTLPTAISNGSEKTSLTRIQEPHPSHEMDRRS
jgi:hypothetical protein